MSFGFSVSDFLAVGRIAVDLADGLKNAGAEYQELVRELESLQRALIHIDKLTTSNSTTEAKALLDNVQSAAILCKYPLTEFAKKVQKYETSLGVGFNTNSPSAQTSKQTKLRHKVKWTFGKMDEVRKLRDYLNVHIGTINTLLITYGIGTMDAYADQIKVESQKTQDDLQKTTSLLQTTTSIIQSEVEANSNALLKINSTLSKAFDMMLNELVVPIKVMQNNLATLYASTQKIYTVIMQIQASMSSIDTRFTYLQYPIKVQDALGRVFPFPSECSYKELNGLIQARFQKGPGQYKVAAGAYEFSDARNSKRRITHDNSYDLVPGMSIIMAMIIETPFGGIESCPVPDCMSVSCIDVASGGRQWDSTECNVWFDTTSKKLEPEEDEEKEEEIRDDIYALDDSEEYANCMNGFWKPHKTDCDIKVGCIRNVRVGAAFMIITELQDVTDHFIRADSLYSPHQLSREEALMESETMLYGGHMDSSLSDVGDYSSVDSDHEDNFENKLEFGCHLLHTDDAHETLAEER